MIVVWLSTGVPLCWAGRKWDRRAATKAASSRPCFRCATVLKRWRLSDGSSARPVAHLKHGLEEAALVAARRSRFRPAQHNGTPVESQTTITFEFGPSER